MSDIISIIKMLPDMEHVSPASNEEIKSAEEKLNLKFAEEYKEYLASFGMAWSDIIALSGIIADEDYNVVDLTNKLRLLQPEIPMDLYAIEDVGVDGLVIWQSGDGTVYQSIPNHNPVKIFDNLTDFLNYQMED